MDKKIANSAKGCLKISSFDEQTTGVDPKKAEESIVQEKGCHI